MGILLRNWHLKLSAVLLAAVLYTGLVFAGAFSESTIQVRVEQANQPTNAYVLTGDLGFVEVRYRASREILGALVAEAFVARVDLGDYDMDRAAEPQILDVEVRSLTDGVEILSVDPATVRVEVDRIDQRIVPVEVDTGVVPEGLEIAEPELSENEAQVRGPASIVRRIDRAVALVSIDASGIDFDRPVDLVAVDIEGQPVGAGLIEIVPQTISVRVDVQAVEETRTVVVRPQITGTPAPGFALESLEVSPSTITLRGLPQVLAEIGEVLTQSLSIDGVASDQSFEAEVILPEGARLADGTADPVVQVTAAIVPSVSSRTFVVGVVCQGSGANACLPGLTQMSVTVSGPGEVLSALSAGDLTPIVDVTGLAPGTYSVTPVIAGLPNGVEILAVSPGAVPVSLVAPATPTPQPTPEPTPEP
jgi:YbbR domain-containing protein